MQATAGLASARPKFFARIKALPLFRRDIPAARAWDAVGWWESRRIAYNLIVGTAGIVSCTLVAVAVLSYAALEHQLSSRDVGTPGLGVMVVVQFAVSANVFYTFGWIAELIVRKFRPKESDRFAATSFFLGILFSVVVTLGPGVIAVVVATVVGIARLVGAYH